MKKGMLGVWILVVALVVLIGAGGYYMMNGGSFAKIQKTDYQAVFLSNGQVYFGKVSNENSSTVTLKDIYYLQVQQQVQPTDSKDKAAADQQQVQLVKLGNEIHGPVDQMRINHDQILFVEDLKADGKVVTAIHNYQTSNK